MTLEQRWSKCITLESNYIEIEEVDLTRKTFTSKIIFTAINAFQTLFCIVIIIIIIGSSNCSIGVRVVVVVKVYIRKYFVSRKTLHAFIPNDSIEVQYVTLL